MVSHVSAFFGTHLFRLVCLIFIHSSSYNFINSHHRLVGMSAGESLSKHVHPDLAESADIVSVSVFMWNRICLKKNFFFIVQAEPKLFRKLFVHVNFSFVFAGFNFN